MSLANSSGVGYWVQFHEEGQSPYNYEIEKRKAYYFDRGNELAVFFEDQIQTQKLNKKVLLANLMIQKGLQIV